MYSHIRLFQISRSVFEGRWSKEKISSKCFLNALSENINKQILFPLHIIQLIIAEAAPGMEGHKLAQNLIKTPNISITLIPDSNIYAMMARVNKVIFSPLAIMADGGSIANSGLLMVATAAKVIDFFNACWGSIMIPNCA